MIFDIMFFQNLKKYQRIYDYEGKFIFIYTISILSS